MCNSSATACVPAVIFCDVWKGAAVLDSAVERPLLQWHTPLLAKQRFLHKLGSFSTVGVRPQQPRRRLPDRGLHFQKLRIGQQVSSCFAACTHRARLVVERSGSAALTLTLTPGYLPPTRVLALTLCISSACHRLLLLFIKITSSADTSMPRQTHISSKTSTIRSPTTPRCRRISSRLQSGPQRSGA